MGMNGILCRTSSVSSVTASWSNALLAGLVVIAAASVTGCASTRNSGSQARGRPSPEMVQFWGDMARLAGPKTERNLAIPPLEPTPAEVLAPGEISIPPRPSRNLRPPLSDLSSRRAQIRALFDRLGKDIEPLSPFRFTAVERDAAQAAIERLRAGGLLVANVEVKSGLSAILERLASVSPEEDVPWSVYVVADREVNAFSLGGGVLCVTVGMLRHVKNEAQVAHVLGHEMGHDLLGHLSAPLRDQFWREVILPLLQNQSPPQAAVPFRFDYRKDHEPEEQITSVEQLSKVTEASVNRARETDADRLGLSIANEAGYDPREALKLLTSFASSGTGASVLLSRHPDPIFRSMLMLQWVGPVAGRNLSDRIVDTIEFQNLRGRL